MRVRGFARVVLATALASLLAACWMSEKPLIGDRNAVAVDFAGTYLGDGGDGEGPEEMVFAATGPTSYELGNEAEERVPARFAALPGGWYLMQGAGESDEEGAPPYYLYFMVRRAEGNLHIHALGCEDIAGKFSGLKREAMAYSQEESGEAPETCKFSRFDGLKKMAAAWVAAFGKGQLSSEPEVLRPVATP